MKIPFSRFLAAALPVLFAIPAFGDAGWTTNYAKAVEQAKAEDKAILLDFTGSDWCGWCMKMKKETLDTPMFKDYAGKNLVLVEVDFPHNKPQSDQVKAQNQELSDKFGASGFPTFVVVSKTGRVLGKQVGYLEGGPEAFIAELKKFYKGSPNAGASPVDDFDAFFHHPAQSPTP
jgi:protein disulfide-isomerase